MRKLSLCLSVRLSFVMIVTKQQFLHASLERYVCLFQNKKDEKKEEAGQKKLGVIIGLTLGLLTVILIATAILFWKLQIQPKTKTHSK